MIGDYLWYDPLPRNYSVPAWQVRLWQLSGRHYRKSPEFKLLKRIELQREEVARESAGRPEKSGWLLSYRKEFRSVIDRSRASWTKREADVIRYYMASCPPEMIPVCLWLISRCNGSVTLHGSSEFCRDRSLVLRKHFAKALRRAEEWPLLNEMALRFPEDAMIQWCATIPPKMRRPFAERLTRYVQSVDDSHADEAVTPSRMPFWAAERTWDYTPTKSIALIRRMLRRIRHWVRWGVS